MKKLFTAQLPAIFFLLVTIVTACSQNLALNTTTVTSASLISNEKPGEPVYQSDVNPKVLKNFYRSYGKIQDANWYRSKNGFIVSFVSDGIRRLVYYMPNGSVDCKINYYFEEQLLPAVRHLVKSTFYDYHIFHVTEVEKNGITAFYVKIQDSTTIKTIKVVEGEWEMVENMLKR